VSCFLIFGCGKNHLNILRQYLDYVFSASSLKLADSIGYVVSYKRCLNNDWSH
jgi:DNA primase